MPSIWRIRRIKGYHYLYYENEYIGSIEKIVELWRACLNLNPGPLAPKAGL